MEQDTKDFIKDLLISTIVIIAIFGGLFAYSGIWPPIVVIDSASMQHGNQFQFGVINVGDIVLVKKVSSLSSIITYVQGRETGYKTYGDYGDVIIYHSSFLKVPVIHRAMFNIISWKGSIPVIAGEKHATFMTIMANYVILQNVGYSHRNLIVNLHAYIGKEGIVTMGDHNLALAPVASFQPIYPHIVYTAADQDVGISNTLITLHNLVGVAQGWLPWFGDLKLLVTGEGANIPSNSLIFMSLSIAAIISIPFLLDFTKAYIRKKKKLL